MYSIMHEVSVCFESYRIDEMNWEYGSPGLVSCIYRPKFLSNVVIIPDELVMNLVRIDLL